MGEAPSTTKGSFGFTDRSVSSIDGRGFASKREGTTGFASRGGDYQREAINVRGDRSRIRSTTALCEGGIGELPHGHPVVSCGVEATGYGRSTGLGALSPGPLIARHDQFGEDFAHRQNIRIARHQGIGLCDMREYQKHLVLREAGHAPAFDPIHCLDFSLKLKHSTNFNTYSKQSPSG